MEFDSLLLFTREPGDYEVQVDTATEDNGRVMKLHGASRTYSHTAEPRLVNQAKEVKDWPIKEEKQIVETNVIVESGDVEVELSLDPINISSWKVTVNEEELTWSSEYDCFCNNEETIELGYNSIEKYYWFWAQEGGTYNLNIVAEEKVVDPTFAEAVNIVAGGSNVPILHLVQDGGGFCLIESYDEVIKILQNNEGKPIYVTYATGYDWGLLSEYNWEGGNFVVRMFDINPSTKVLIIWEYVITIDFEERNISILQNGYGYNAI